VRIAARERTPERRGADAEREVPEVVEAEEARDQRNVRRASTCIHWPQSPAPITLRARRTGAEIELDGNVLERICARGECQLECSRVVLSWVVGSWEEGGDAPLWLVMESEARRVNGTWTWVCAAAAAMRAGAAPGLIVEGSKRYSMRVNRPSGGTERALDCA
jgi:hypothetical protein